MNSDAFELASLSLYLEAQVADLRTMLEKLPIVEFRSPENRDTFLRLRGAATELTLLWCVAHAYSERTQSEETT